MQTQMNFDHLVFNGPDYNPHRDNTRLGNQMLRIIELMKDEKFRTMKEISTSCEAPEASVSAQLRHLRKERFGGHQVNRMKYL